MRDSTMPCDVLDCPKVQIQCFPNYTKNQEAKISLGYFVLTLPGMPGKTTFTDTPHKDSSEVYPCYLVKNLCGGVEGQGKMWLKTGI